MAMGLGGGQQGRGRELVGGGKAGPPLVPTVVQSCCIPSRLHMVDGVSVLLDGIHEYHELNMNRQCSVYHEYE